MKKFTVKIVIFLLPVAALYFFIEHKLSKIPNSYNLKKALIEKQLDSIEVLALGPSSALYGINPGYFSHYGFNLADVSQSIYYDKRLALKYLAQMPKLKLVLITINPYSFYEQLHYETEEWRDYFYYHFWNIKYKDLPLFDARKYSYTALYSINITRQYIASDFTSPGMAPDYTEKGNARNDSAGHLQKITDSTGKILANNTNKEFSEYLKMDKNGNEINYITNDLEEFVTDLKRKNIRVAFINIPAYHTYSGRIDDRILSLNDSIVHSLSEKYSCTYFNYFLDRRFTIDDFADDDHLSTTGATKFSKIIDSEIIQPAFRQ